MMHFACDRIHDLVDDMYESLHTSEGDPIEESAAVYDLVAQFKYNVNEELDLIRTASDEHDELREKT